MGTNEKDLPAWARIAMGLSSKKKELSVREADAIIDKFRNFESEAVFEALLPYLDSDIEAQDMFLMLLRPSMTMFRLSKFADVMKKGAEKGNKWMQYAWAKYNDAVGPEENSRELSIEYYEKASEAGVSDATMMLAYCWQDGEYGMVDKIKYFSLRDAAAQNGSLKAVWQQMRDLLWGTVAVEKDPQKVYDTLDKFIESSENEEYPIDPVFFTLMGDAAGEVGRPRYEVIGWYRKAIYMGDYSAFLWWALKEADYDEQDGTIGDVDKFRACMAEARKAGAPEGYMTELYITDDAEFRKMGRAEQLIFHNKLESDLMTAVDLGKSGAAYNLGLFYYYGYYGFKEDDNHAWRWFAKGALLRNSSCYAMLSRMCGEGCAPEDYSDKEHEYYYALQSVRYGNDEMQNKVVEGYSSGYLTDFAAEIEQYYNTELDD